MQTLNSVIKCAGSSAHLMLLEVTVRKYKVRAQLVVGRKYIQQIKVLSSVYLFVSPASQVVPTSHITLAVSAPPLLRRVNEMSRVPSRRRPPQFVWRSASLNSHKDGARGGPLTSRSNWKGKRRSGAAARLISSQPHRADN